MKKFLVTVLVFSFSASMISQEGHFDLGIKAGVNFANLTDASGFSNRTGFVFGGFVGGKFSEKIGMQADVLYSQQGAELDLGAFKTDYVNVPVVLKYYLLKPLNIQVGPQFGFLINDDTKVILENVITDIQTKSFDLSWVVGVGLDIASIRIEGRYNFGLTGVPENNNINTISQNSKNSVVTLSVGMSFF